jgi:hypothetical protein
MFSFVETTNKNKTGKNKSKTKQKTNKNKKWKKTNQKQYNTVGADSKSNRNQR